MAMMQGVQLLDTMGVDQTPASAARVSFHAENREMDARDEKLIRYLAKHQHSSPFEHVTARFAITCPLYVARQIMRHRTFSYNEVSRRYTSEDLAFEVPEKLRHQSTQSLQCSDPDLEVEDQEELISMIEMNNLRALNLYQDLLDCGVAREQARAVLPQGLLTSFWMTGNLWNWSRFLRLRLDGHAQPEAQIVAQSIYDALYEKFPVCISSLLPRLDHHD